MTHARLTEARRIIAELAKYAPGAYLTDPRPDAAIDSGKDQAFEDAQRFLSAPEKAIPGGKPVFFLQGDPTNRVKAMRSGALLPVSHKMNKTDGYCTPMFLHPAPNGAQRQDAKSLRAIAVDSAAEIEALKAEVDQLRQHNAALRQQLADVTNERDGLREGFSHQAKLVAEDQETIESLEGRLDASEARNSEAAELLREASKSIIRHQAEQPMSRRLSGLLTKTRTAINKHLAQTAPATTGQVQP